MALLTQNGFTIVTQAGVPIGPVLAAPVTPWPDPQTLAQLRVRIGLPINDATRDADITAVWTMATLLAEQYLDRFIRPGAYTESFTHVTGNSISLKGYPLTTLPVITDHSGSTSIPFHADANNGVVYFDGAIASHSLSVAYECAPPTGIMVALIMLFDSLWTTANSTGGAVAAGGIKSISSSGATISYFDPTAGGGTGGIDMNSGLPSGVAAMLNPFRRQAC
jgi:hypothetical protein